MTNVNNIPQSSTTSPAPTTPPLPAGPTTLSSGRNGNDSSTDTIAAITVAVVAVIIVLTILFVSRAFIKRRRARQGERMDQPVPTVSTGIMGTPVNAYANLHRNIQWESVTPAVTPASANQNLAQSSHDPESTRYDLPPPGTSAHLDSAL